MALTNKRKVFVEEYLKCWNASEAARRAGYRGKSNVVGPRLLANVSIQAAIQSRLDELKMSADEVLLRLAEMARADISEFVTAHGIIDWAKVREKGHLVKKVRHNIGKNSEIELHDAKDALVWIGKHHKLFTDKVEHSGEISTKDVSYTDDQRAKIISAIIDRARARDTGQNSNE